MAFPQMVVVLQPVLLSSCFGLQVVLLARRQALMPGPQEPVAFAHRARLMAVPSSILLWVSGLLWNIHEAFTASLTNLWRFHYPIRNLAQLILLLWVRRLQ
jgi:hypothetical protein